MKPKMLHVPLEKYTERYTEFLADVEKAAFEQLFGEVVTVEPQNSGPAFIRKGRVLDQMSRPARTMAQSAEIITLSSKYRGPIYFSDFYHTGLDGIAYAGVRNKMYSFLWAQTFDCHDFTVEMVDWMRAWEHMAFNIYSKVFVASSLLAELITTAIPSVADKIIVAGLPFNSDHVRGLLNPKDVLTEEFDCVYSSRWDKEKNPGFFLDLVETLPDVRFVVCTGKEELTGTDEVNVKRAHEIASRKGTNLFIRQGLSRSKYYAYLQASKCQFNCGSQDWVSYTLLEALAFECTPVYPMHRSFPEALLYEKACLYDPLRLVKAAECLQEALQAPCSQDYREAVLSPHNLALEFVTQVIYDERS